MVGEGSRIDSANNVGNRHSRLDFGVLARHVLAQLWHGASVCVVGGGNAILLDDDVRLGRAVLEGLEDVDGDFG